MGGLGIMDLRTFNNAIVENLKWCWKWVKLQNNLLKPLLYHRELSYDLIPTEMAKLITELKQFWQISSKRTVGDGTSISFGHHNWGWGIISSRYAELYTCG
jgi:hypothetical protein